MLKSILLSAAQLLSSNRAILLVGATLIVSLLAAFKIAVTVDQVMAFLTWALSALFLSYGIRAPGAAKKEVTVTVEPPPS